MWVDPGSTATSTKQCQWLSHLMKHKTCRQRPYRVECTGSLPNSEVKRRRARLVLGWGTAREDLRVLLAFLCVYLLISIYIYMCVCVCIYVRVVWMCVHMWKILFIYLFDVCLP